MDKLSEQERREIMTKAFQTREGTINAYKAAKLKIPQAASLEVPEHVGDTPAERAATFYWALGNMLRSESA